MIADVEKMYFQIKIAPRCTPLPVERSENGGSTESLQNAKTDIWSEL